MSDTPALQRRLQQQQVVAELGQAALETGDPDQLMHEASVVVAETLGNEYCKVLELLPGGEDVFLRQGVGWRDGLVGSATVPTHLDSQAGYTLITEEPVIVDDLRTEERFSGPELLTSHDVVSGISVIIGSVEEPWGVLGTHTTERQEFTDDAAAFVQSVANILATAIERRERERKLARYQALTEAANDVIVTIDEDSVIQSVNPVVEDIFGYDRTELLGESLTRLMPDELAEPHREGVTRYVETGERSLDWDYVELTGERADGTEIPLAISFSEVKIDGERFFTGVVRDISERKEYERRLEKSHERLEEFATAVSHDLREPLGTVASYLQLLEQRYEEELDEDAEEFIEFAVGGASRMKEMIDGLVSSYTRVEADGDPLEPIDLDMVLEEVLTDFEPKIDGANAEITNESLPCVEADRGQIRQVFMNLLDNAIKYAGDAPPRVHMSADRDDGMWTISVSDEGIGIAPEAADAAFEVFHRCHAQEEYPGSGIGLALCERIVERHGGAIWVESEPGAGSMFSFTLPAYDSA